MFRTHQAIARQRRMQRSSGLLVLVLVLCLIAPVMADTVTLRPDHPNKYTVRKGDTLWDIAATFLQDPWMWPEIWQINEDIANPHLIYPGDILHLRFNNDGRPEIIVQRKTARRDTQADTPPPAARPPATVTAAADGDDSVRKLRPRIRRSALDISEAIPTIPSELLAKFLEFPRVVKKRDMLKTGYIVATDEGRLISGRHDRVYARELEQDAHKRLSVMRLGKPFRDPESWKVLGYEAMHIAEARLIETGDPSTLSIIESRREVLTGDRLLPSHQDALPENFLPHAPEKKVRGEILSVLDGSSTIIGRYQIIAINIGTRHGIEHGHVLSIRQSGGKMRDPYTLNWNKRVRLPDQHVGTIMVIRPFEKVSYALVMEARKDLRLRDIVVNP